MKKKSVLAGIALASVLVLGAGIGVATATDNLAFQANADAYTTRTLLLDANNVKADGENVEIKREGTDSIFLNVSGIKEVKDGKIYLNKGAVIENVTKIQNIKKMDIAGSLNNNPIKGDMEEVPFKLGFGFEMNSERTIVRRNLPCKQSYDFWNQSPSYFVLEANLDNIAIDSLTFNFSCANDGNHATAPAEYSSGEAYINGDAEVMFVGKENKPLSWSNGIAFDRNPDDYTQFRAILDMPENKNVKVRANCGTISKDDGDWGNSNKNSFECATELNEIIQINRDDGCIHSNQACKIVVYWKQSGKAYIGVAL